MPPIERIHNFQEAAELLQLTVPELSELIREGKLKANIEERRVRDHDLRAYKLTNWQAEGFASVMGQSLQIEVFGKTWSLAIRTLAEHEKGNFYSFHQKRMAPADILPYLGNPATLEWKPLKKLFPGITEYVATTPSYRIHLTIQGDNPLPLDQARAELEQFLA